jgi:Ca2+-binding RTX toxin-like protein
LAIRTLIAVFVWSICIAGFVPTAGAQAPPDQGFNLNASDLRFFLQQIKIAENHAAGGSLLGSGPNQIPNPLLPWGLRTVDGSFNNLLNGQELYGAADRVFPRLLTPRFRPAENWTFDPDGPGPIQLGDPTTYAQKSGIVNDSQPRTASNLIVDQTPSNPSAVAAATTLGEACATPGQTCFIPNVAPDVGLSAPFNTFFTFFGQFFDHGLDLVTKGGGTVFVPLQPDDPILTLFPNAPPFMVLTRATNQPGEDGVLGTADDVQDGTNTTTPFVDQNQTYTSHSSHQVFLRQYTLNAAGKPVATGKMLDGAISGNIGNWGEVKAQAAIMLGIQLTDEDVFNVPLLATDPYGRFLRGLNGYPVVAFPNNVFVEGNPAAPISVVGSLKTGHGFLDDIAHNAVPSPGLIPDSDNIITPQPQPAGTYDDELLAAHFCTGDGRGNENIALTAVHTVFHSEHNRLVDNIDGLISALLTPAEIAEWRSINPNSGYDYGERLFQAARFVTEMEYQHLVFEEFARKVQPMVNAFTNYKNDVDPAIVAEFAHTVYRFGHSMLTETVSRTNPDGSTNDIALLDAFLNPLAFNNGGALGTLTAAQAAGSIIKGSSRQVANEIDEFVTEALRNRLLGLPLDLATINMARGRSEGIPRLNEARRQFFHATGAPELTPYVDWFDFGLALRHPESLVNFIAAYGIHPTITGTLEQRRAAAQILANDPAFLFLPASGSGVDDIDFWVGGIAEKQSPFGGLLGSTFNYVFESQLEKLQDNDRFYYLSRTAGLNLVTQLEGNSFAELVSRNTTAAGLPADAFSHPALVFNLANLGTSGPIPNDPSTPYDESALLVRLSNGTIRYNGPEHVVWNGTAATDRVASSEGDDTLRGNDGRDFLEGGSGNDVLLGGNGDDILTDAFGDDVLKGGDGNDVLSSGSGTGGDLNQGGRGKDFIFAGSDFTATLGGPDDDFIYTGDGSDEGPVIKGDDGDDWLEGGVGSDLLVGDSAAPALNDLNAAGNDVLIGRGGNDDLDMEGGDDIGVAGPGVEKVVGNAGFDWITHKSDLQPAQDDLNISIFGPPDVNILKDKYKDIEGLSGWMLDDILLGSSGDATSMVGHELTAEGIARIAGLSALLPPATTLFTGGDIILGGAGSDLIEGREGDDIIDGDAWLNVQLRAPVPAAPGTFQLVDSMLQLRADVLAGRINPGDISIVRSIVSNDAQPSDVDTAQFTGTLDQYIRTENPDGTLTVTDTLIPGDGADTLRNIEQLTFLNCTGFAIPGALPRVRGGGGGCAPDTIRGVETIPATIPATGPPVGSVDLAVDAADGDTTVASGGSLLITGWAADPDTGAPVTRVEVRIDGTVLGNAVLGGARSDIASFYARPDFTNSGWSLTANIPSLTPGAHTITAVAFDSTGASRLLLGERTIMRANSPPVGALEGAVDVADGDNTLAPTSTLRVQGWAADPDFGAPVSRVEISIDDIPIANAVLGGDRTDIANQFGRTDFTNSGWSADVNIGAVPLGTHTVTVMAFDSSGAFATLAGARTFTITADGAPPVNVAPAATNDVAATSEDTAANIAVLANDTDSNPADVGSLTVSSVTQGANGTVTINNPGTANNSVRYAPNANFSGSDSFTYTVADPGGLTATATVTVTVTPVNDPPVAVNDAATTTQPAAVTIQVLTNDSDSDGNALTVSAAGPSPNGTVTFTANSVTFTPTSGFSGNTSVPYTISDGNGGTATASIAVTVNAAAPDTVAPVATIPVVTILAPTIQVGGTVPTTVSWSATDTGSGVARYQLQQSRNGGAFTNVALPSPTATTVQLNLAAGTYRFRVRATDVAGNVGAFRTTAAINAFLRSETNTTRTGTWTRVGVAGASGGALSFSTQTGATARLTFRARSVGWVTVTGPNRGIAQVSVDGSAPVNVDLYSPTTRLTQVLFSTNGLNPAVNHNLTIRVTGTRNPASTGTRVDVDGFGLLR